MSKLEQELDELEIKFLHGVPVKLPTEAKQRLVDLITRAKIEENKANLYICNNGRGLHSNEWLTDFFSLRINALQATLKENN